MNKFILTLSVAALAAVSLPLSAQDAKPNGGQGRGGPRMSPEERLKKMTESLSLNQEQQDKIKAIMEENRGKFEEVRNLPEDQRREKMRELFQAQMEKIGEVLTPEQKEKWKAEMEKRRSEGGRRGEGRAKAEEKK